jgi:hypothetical protein
MTCLSYYLVQFLFNKIREEEGRTGSVRKCRLLGVGVGRGGIMYIHVSRGENDKIKGEKENKTNMTEEKDRLAGYTNLSRQLFSCRT